jgi:hypothetical protein
VKKFKPKRILMACGWQAYLCEDYCKDLDKDAVCNI